MSAPPRLELRGITKLYPGVRANDGIDLSVAAGEIHAVLGENGAGKSTLMKIIYGALRADAGRMFWNGRAVSVASPAQARALGIGMVYQHFSLFDSLSVAENIRLGLPGYSLAQVAKRLLELAASYGLDVEPRQQVHTLSVGQRQRVEIVRALLGGPQLLILDEPTSVLTPHAVEGLFATLRRLAAGGCSILYISHKLDEIRALAHRCTVLRAGQVVAAVEPGSESNASLSRLMIGAEPPPLVHRRTPPGAPVLEVRALSLARATPFGSDLAHVSFEVREREVLGVAGVSGNGQQELLAALSGEDARAPPGSIRLCGRDVAREGPRERRRAGLHFVPEERLGRGAAAELSLAQNTLLTRSAAVSPLGALRMRVANEMAAGIITRYRVQAAGPGARAQTLSGGNLQKFIVGREIDARPRLLVAAQPTWGVDVGAAVQIRAALLALRDEGAALVVVSEDLDELFEISDRIVVIARGRTSPSVTIEEASVELIGQWMSGLWPTHPYPLPRAGEGAVRV